MHTIKKQKQDWLHHSVNVLFGSKVSSYVSENNVRSGAIIVTDIISLFLTADSSSICTPKTNDSLQLHYRGKLAQLNANVLWCNVSNNQTRANHVRFDSSSNWSTELFTAPLH